MKALAHNLLITSMLVSCFFVACGGDESGDPSPLGPSETAEGPAVGTEESAIDPIALAVFEDLGTTMSQAVGIMLSGGGALEGELGTLAVEGTVITLSGYSPDGQLILDGELTLDIFANPITVKGAVTLSGSSSGEVVVDMTVASGESPAYGGSVTVDGTQYDVSAFGA